MEYFRNFHLYFFFCRKFYLDCTVSCQRLFETLEGCWTGRICYLLNAFLSSIFAYVHVCVDAQRHHKQVLHPLGLKLQAAGNSSECMLGIELRFCARVATLTH